MKKIIFLIVANCLIFLMCGFYGCKHSNKIVETEGIKDEGEFEGLVDWDIDLENKVGAMNIIIDESLALEIGNAVLKSVYGNDMMENTRFHVCELQGRNIYVVSRIPKEEILGGDKNVAIDKMNGQILKIWAGE